jgi:hypothetical protein
VLRRAALARLLAAVLPAGLLALPTAAAQVAPPAPPSRPSAAVRHVLAISVDGLNTTAVRRLGTAGTPTLHRLLAEGAGTLNARTEHEETLTLPDHTSMMTGRRIDETRSGHGVTWDDDRSGSTVQEAAGHPVASVFTKVHAAGGTTALYTTKSKFGLFERSWPRSIDTFVVRADQRRLTRLVSARLQHRRPTFTFLHVSLPDRAGHAHGGMSDAYLTAVRRTDAQLGRVLSAVSARDTAVVLTADHGFASGSTSHADPTDLEDFRVPFVAWGAGVGHARLYAINPAFRDPGTRRTTYAGRQPVRNGDLANLATELLGLGPVPGSTIDHAQRLRVRR